MELKFSEPKLNHNNYCPYIEIDFKTKLTLDKEAYFALAVHSENMLNVLVAEYRQALEEKLETELKKYNLTKRI